jgi:hypothetical protein
MMMGRDRARPSPKQAVEGPSGLVVASDLPSRRLFWAGASHLLG